MQVTEKYWVLQRESGKFWVFFFLIDFEEGCFSLLTLLYLSKKHVLITCSKIQLNITAKIIPECKV